MPILLSRGFDMGVKQLSSAGVVEIERDGCIHRGAYRSDGTTLSVVYGAFQKRTKLNGAVAIPEVMARLLLRRIVSEMHAQI